MFGFTYIKALGILSCLVGLSANPIFGGEGFERLFVGIGKAVEETLDQHPPRGVYWWLLSI